MIAVVDYGMGNRRSVEKALEHVGADAIRTGDPEAVAAADRVLVPGVGAFPEAMRRLRASGLDEAIARSAAAGAPVLGVCLGMQLLFEGSREFEGARGLAILPGEVTPLRAPKVPHIGWNEVAFERRGALTAGLGDAAAFYHVHSLVCRPADPAIVVGRGDYGERFASIVESANVMGVQFHPEKSSRDGLALLRNFAAAG